MFGRIGAMSEVSFIVLEADAECEEFTCDEDDLPRAWDLEFRFPFEILETEDRFAAN
jgi:hypothetical protein